MTLTRGDLFDIAFVIAIIAIWLFVNKWLLPKMGAPG